MKVLTIVGTRPEIIRLSCVINKLDQYAHHVLVHTGQNYDYELNEIFFSDLKIRKPDVFLNAVGNTATETIGQIIIKIEAVLDEHQPDAVLILGDTNSCLAAIVAKRKKIPIFHMEAGNRCFDMRVPEEINRRIVDHISDINLTYSSIARDYLLREGLPADQIIKTGSPMHEVIHCHFAAIQQTDVLNRLELAPEKYFLISLHREENVDSPERLKKFVQILDRLAEQYKLPVVVSTHPRTRKRLEENKIISNRLVNFMKPFGFVDYIKLQCEAKCVLSDSGTITEESSILNFPALNLRDVHERPEGFEEGSVMLVGLDWNKISDALAILQNQSRGQARQLNFVRDYETLNVSDKVLRIILSYTNFVNQRVWRKGAH